MNPPPSLIKKKIFYFLIAFQIAHEIFILFYFKSDEQTCNYKEYNSLFSELVAHYVLQSKGI